MRGNARALGILSNNGSELTEKDKLMEKEELMKMKSMEWYHKIDLGNGIITPGNEWDYFWDPLKKEIREVDIIGKRVLDIGCWDGMWSFEVEKLGASEVWSTDIINQRSFSGQGFQTLEFARKHLNSKVRYKEASVYDIDDHFDDEFDLVIFFGVLYHLRYPQLGMAKIRNVLKTGGILLLETAILLDTQDTIIQTDFRKIYPDDISTWNAFSMPALLSLIEESYFHPESSKVILRQDEKRKIGRGFVKARAYSGKHYHHFYEDNFLKKQFASLK